MEAVKALHGRIAAARRGEVQGQRAG
jgi:hypothetical protein